MGYNKVLSLLFNIFLIDLFFRIEDFDIASCADGNTPYLSTNNMDGFAKSLEEASTKLVKWFRDNLMKSNADKCRSLFSTNNTVNKRAENFDIKNGDCEKLLGVKFDHKLTFNISISMSYLTLCKKASKNVHPLSRVTPYINISKRRIIMNSFLKSQFSYCSLV